MDNTYLKREVTNKMLKKHVDCRFKNEYNRVRTKLVRWKGVF